MGSVVEHTPAEAARVFAVGVGGVQHPRMAQRVLLPMRCIVKGFCGVHVAVAFRNQECFVHVGCHVLFALGPGVCAVVGEIVVGIDILEQMTFF